MYQIRCDFNLRGETKRWWATKTCFAKESMRNLNPTPIKGRCRAFGFRAVLKVWKGNAVVNAGKGTRRKKTKGWENRKGKTKEDTRVFFNQLTPFLLCRRPRLFCFCFLAISNNRHCSPPKRMGVCMCMCVKGGKREWNEEHTQQQTTKELSLPAKGQQHPEKMGKKGGLKLLLLCA